MKKLLLHIYPISLIGFNNKTTDQFIYKLGPEGYDELNFAIDFMTLKKYDIAQPHLWFFEDYFNQKN